MSLRKIVTYISTLAIGLSLISGNGIYTYANNAMNNSNSSNTSNAGVELVDDEVRKQELGEFYVPMPKVPKEKREIEVRGIYVNPEVAGQNFSEENIEAYKNFISEIQNGGNPSQESVSNINSLEKALAMAQTTPLNSLVIDIKTDIGTIAWKSNIEAVNRLDASTNISNDDFKSLLEYMNSHNIYAIARIVVFKDVNISQKEPEHAITLKDGSIFKDYADQSWLNPFDDYVWKYTTAISQEAAIRGFDEIHFDYLRYPENAADYNDEIELPGREGQPKDESIAQFLTYARENLDPYGVRVSAAVFGTVNTSWEDVPEDIGQTWRKITDKVDRISPMIYPSHYGNEYLGLKVPDSKPYEFIKSISLRGLNKNMLVENPATYTPWIQAFTADWVDGHIEYTPDVIKEQIKALNHIGHDSYLLWNASGKYDPRIFIYNKENSEFKEGSDIVGTLPNEVVPLFFNSLMNEENIPVYALTPITNRPYDYNEYKSMLLANEISIDSYSYEENGGLGNQKVTLTYSKAGQKHENEVIDVEVINEGGYYKVKVPETFLKLK